MTLNVENKSQLPNSWTHEVSLRLFRTFTCVWGVLTSWLLLLGLISVSLTRDDLISAKSPSSSEWLISAKICSFCGSPSSLNGIISSVAQSSGSPPPPPPDNCGISRVIESPPHPTNARKANACDRNPRILSARTLQTRARVFGQLQQERATDETLENPEGKWNVAALNVLKS